MSGKLAIGGLVAVAVMALSANTADAQRVVRHGNHYHTVSPGYGYGARGGYAPAYRPVYVSPFPAYNSGFGFASPGYGYNSGFGWGGGYPGYGYGRSNFSTVNFGVYRPGFNGGFGFVIR